MPRTIKTNVDMDRIENRLSAIKQNIKFIENQLRNEKPYLLNESIDSTINILNSLKGKSLCL